jgi:hypothetical protein
LYRYGVAKVQANSAALACAEISAVGLCRLNPVDP